MMQMDVSYLSFSIGAERILFRKVGEKREEREEGSAVCTRHHGDLHYGNIDNEMELRDRGTEGQGQSYQ